MSELGQQTDQSSGQEAPTIKQAACLECRKSKVKCTRPANTEICKRCSSADLACVVPEYHVGRYKGVKNKRSGLEKAIFQVEEAVKKARTNGPGLQHKHTLALERLIGDGTDLAEDLQETSRRSISTHDQQIYHEPFEEYAIAPDDDRSIVNHADNPLQLLAIASAIPEQPEAEYLVASTDKTSPGNVSSISQEDDSTLLFFSPITSKLDIGADIDPVDLGLMSVSEARVLFAQ